MNKIYASEFIGKLTGNADTASKLATARTISLTGSVTGSGTFDGSDNLSIATTTNHTHNYLPLSGGALTGNVSLKETTNILLRPSSANYTSGIGWDTSGNECLALWAKNSVTRLRWYAGKDMSTMTSGTMMGITPDFEISKASGTAKGYIGGTEISVSGHTHSYLPLSGGTVTGSTVFKQGTIVHYAEGISGTSGYVRIAQLKIVSNYINQPIYFLVFQRGKTISTLEIMFSGANSLDPELNVFRKTEGLVAYLHKSATSTWDLYIQKTEPYDKIEILDFKKGNFMSGRVTVTWANSLVESVPSGATVASTKTELLNISGNAATATKLETARTIALTGSVTGSGTFDGSGNLSIATSTNHSHNYAGSSSAGGSATSAVSVVDYGDTSRTIKIGYSGSGATTSNLTHIAGYLSGGTQIKDVSKDTLKSWLDLGSAAYTSSGAYATASHSHSYLPLSGGTVTGTVTANAFKIGNGVLSWDSSKNAIVISV